MPQQFRHFVESQREPLEAALEEFLPLSSQPQVAGLNEALRYAVFSGGKRWRPMLTLLGALLVGGNVRSVLPIACAVEFLHTSSLILDDLPAMDDADVRRGHPATHLVYGESLALLASLALLNQSYSLFARASHDAASLIEEAARCVGTDGMIGGQAIDLTLRSGEQQSGDLSNRNLKTTALLQLTMTAGAIASRASKADAEALAKFGERLGMAYQICDDLMDALGESFSLGKPVGQDTRHNRLNFAVEFGPSNARQMAMDLIQHGKDILHGQFGARHEVVLLCEAADLVLQTTVSVAVAAGR
jgi:geranylgeranyl diphosphate synthase type II